MNVQSYFQHKSDITETLIDHVFKYILIVICSMFSTSPLQAANYLETFDTVSSFNELINPLKWHAVNFVPASSNIFDISTFYYVSAPHSLKAFAVPSDTVISKASIERKGYNFVEGDTIFMQASFYFEPGADLNEIYIMDIEYEQCYSQAPGPRLKISNGYLSIDRGKIGFSGSFKATEALIPTGKWFRITWQMILGKNSNGTTQLFLDGNKVMDTTGTNIPDSAIFFAAGVTLTTEKLDRFEIGITANSSSKGALLYVDDVSMGNAHGVNLISNRSQTLKMKLANRNYETVLISNSDGEKKTSGFIGDKNISLYDIHGRMVSMSGKSELRNGVYITRFSNKQKQF
jgi:hypothetical protein